MSKVKKKKQKQTRTAKCAVPTGNLPQGESGYWVSIISPDGKKVKCGADGRSKK